jgi:cytochrome c553
MSILRPNVVAAATGVAVLCGAAAAQVVAQTEQRTPDPKRGAVIAAQGTATVPACAQCHAFSGASDSSGAFPRIAGQAAYYLDKQMHDFASPLRANAIMSPIAKAMSADEIADVAAFYASSDGPFLPLASADAAIVEKGMQLAQVGNAAKGLQACNNCHGPDGAGIPPAIPYLAGQYAQYIAFELQMWKRGLRKSSPESMAVVAMQLSDQEIAAVAAYYQQVRAVPDGTTTTTSTTSSSSK